MDIQGIQNSIQPKERSASSSVNDHRSSTEARGVSQVRVSEEALKKVGTDSSAEIAADREKMEQIMNDVNKQLASFNSYLKFEKDEDSQKMVFHIKNTETNETLRQFPSEEFLAISKNITEYLETVQKSDVAGKTPSPVGLITSQVV